MYLGKRILGLITARGGSKGIPRKNLVDVGGKPLIGWTIDAALQSRLLDRLVLSSDDEEIIAISCLLGCEAPFIREAELAGDTATSADVVIDCLERVPGYDYVVLLQPTSPLRTADDIDGVIRQCLDLQAPACVSLCEVDESPFWMYSVGADKKLDPILSNNYARRQDLPEVYSLNGAVYIAEANWFKSKRTFLSDETCGYVMPRGRSLDIDTPMDLQYLQYVLSTPQ